MGDKHTYLAVETEKGFLDIDVPPYQKHCQSEDYFSKGRVRKSIESIFEPEVEYTLLNTVANPEAAEELKKYVSVRDKMEDPWETHEIPMKKKSGSYHKHYLDFSLSLMDLYMDILNGVIKTNLGETSHVCFPIVTTKKVKSSGRHKEMVSWPLIHVIKGEDRVKEFRNIISRLNDDNIYELIKEKQAPQNYEMANVDKLRELEILPLIIESKEWKADANTLRNAVDFLVQFTHRYHFDNRSFFDD